MVLLIPAGVRAARQVLDAPSAELGFHVTMRLSDDRAIARDAVGLRRASQILFAQGTGRGLLAFRVADTHVHVLLATDRTTAGQFARYAQSALRQGLRLPVGFEPARFRPVLRTSHLRNAVRYLFQQERHHGTDFDPAHDGSSLPDLLGMRDLGGASAKALLRELLPRLTARDLREWSGLPDPAAVLPDESLIAQAAASALGIADLKGVERACSLARSAAAHASPLPARELAVLLGVTERAVQRYRKASTSPALVHAIRLQLLHRTLLSRRALPW